MCVSVRRKGWGVSVCVRMCAWCACMCVGECARVCACVFSFVTVTVLNKGVVFKRESTTKCISSICFRLEAAVHML